MTLLMPAGQLRAEHNGSTLEHNGETVTITASQVFSASVLVAIVRADGSESHLRLTSTTPVRIG
ncbi:hypothetical protein O4215_20605 [Rhodococcus maanshanensis]|uniref:hypothetical protein n=1 Tax=Rhodococcus maanshanensis TaxID=183556 RepID=UPI0022B585E7|nr:hypothetical protein [Rhodococcus maanshanensis]MCZ4557966.1 hypothetical protein [Rhodococcus maanshanensis]